MIYHNWSTYKLTYTIHTAFITQQVQNYLKEYFFRYDTKETGEVGEKDFKRVLGDLGVYLSRDGFRILWTAVDFDLRLLY